MKTEIVKTEQTNEIDWSKPQLLKHNNNDLYVLSNGEHINEEFTGIIIYEFGIGSRNLKFSNDWYKSLFTPITEPITIKFIP